MTNDHSRKQLVQRLKKDKTNPDAWVDYAFFEMEHGDLLTAERACKKALKLTDMEHVNALYVLGLVYIQKDDRERALKVLRKAEHLAPEAVQISLIIGSVFIELRKVKEGERHARRLTEEHPADPLVWNYLGIILDMRGKHTEAEQALRRSLFNDNSIPNTWLSLGVCLEGRKRFGEAEEAYKRAVYLEPEDLQPRKCLEQLYLKMGRDDDASLVWQRDLGTFYKHLPHDQRVKYDEYLAIGNDALNKFLQENFGITPEMMEKVDFEA